jgi:hypothetical protein
MGGRSCHPFLCSAASISAASMGNKAANVKKNQFPNKFLFKKEFFMNFWKLPLECVSVNIGKLYVW